MGREGVTDGQTATDWTATLEEENVMMTHVRKK